MFNALDIIEVAVMPEEIRLLATIRHTDGPHLLFSVNASDASLFIPGLSIKFIQAAEGGLYVCGSTVVNRRDNLVVAKTGRPQLMQRRRSKRLPCDLAAYYQNGLSIADLTALPNDQMNAGHVYDLSLGGAQIYVPKIISAQTNLGIRICLNANEKINVEAIVIRCGIAETHVEIEHVVLPNVIALRFCSVARFDQVQLHRFLTALD